jgi:hypothetical protein
MDPAPEPRDIVDSNLRILTKATTARRHQTLDILNHQELEDLNASLQWLWLEWTETIDVIQEMGNGNRSSALGFGRAEL